MNRFILVQNTILPVIYSLTSLLVLIGSGLIYRYNKSIFLLNLAIADTLSDLTIPIQFIFRSKYFLKKCSCSLYICLLSKSIEILGYNASTLTICIIAVDRFHLVYNQLKQRHRIKIRCALLFIWILPSLFSTSGLISIKVNTYFNSYQQLISCQILFFPLTAKIFF
ncbi:unnamed protein product [Rotaria sordida]|uniref:G-protein coupled receptors family 1 profile domain-containing protein n=1 Tax=Rotaria sordida TaxID=392033 RepID=A0A815IX11_9BILA|nr:unnamed protein product [Rotaria sordida]